MDGSYKYKDVVNPGVNVQSKTKLVSSNFFFLTFYLFTVSSQNKN